MKWLFLILTTLATVPHAQAYQAPPIELMKCASLKGGTLWISFLSVTFAGETKPVAYPSQLGLFQPGFDGLQYISPIVTSPEGLADLSKTIHAKMADGYVELEFIITKTNSVTGLVTKSLQKITASRDETAGQHYYMGNWIIQDSGQPSIGSMAGCTVY